MGAQFSPLIDAPSVRGIFACHVHEVAVTPDAFDRELQCPNCHAVLQLNPYEGGQKYCPNGCGYAVHREAEREVES